MPSQPPLPPLLLPYTSQIPSSSLTLITSVLGATSNWLVLRFLYATLNGTSTGSQPRENGSPSPSGNRVVLLSFLRNYDFWRGQAKRLGLDLQRLSEQGRFAFIDGLSELFAISPAPSSSQAQQSGATPLRPSTTLPVRAASATGPVPARGPAASTIISVSKAPAASTQSTPAAQTQLHFTGRGVSALDSLEKDVLGVIANLQTKNNSNNNGRLADSEENNDVVLIIDQPDLLLAATGPAQGIGATEMSEWLMGLQQGVHSTILTASADSPLIHNASTPASGGATGTPLETEHAAFVIGLAHRARMVMQLRTLDTGAAKDVSGVLRVSKGGEQEEHKTGEETWEEKELLYFVQRDAGIRVFGRGE